MESQLSIHNNELAAKAPNSDIYSSVDLFEKGELWGK